MSKPNVLIVGAGLGGLCLGQKLRAAGIDVRIFERDASPWDRPQGYRLHIDADGENALRDALSPDSYALYEATAMRPVDSTTVLDTALREKRRVPSDEHGGTRDRVAAEGLPRHANVDRATLRQILLTGLQDVCRFDARLGRYESDDEGVTAIFADGMRVRGDILVGADGIRSTVRKQRAPGARTMDAGLRAIYGRIPLERAVRVVPERACEDVFTIATDERNVFLGLGPVIFPNRPDVASAELVPQANLTKQDDYVVCIVGGRYERFGADEATLRQATSVELQRRAVEMLAAWPERAPAIPAQGDPSSFFYVEMHSSVPSDLGPATNVTLLGDAVHAMTPTLGRGANVAMRDGALLGRYIANLRHDRSGIAEALNAYEAEMTSYGFDTVRKAASMGERLVGQNPLP